MVASSAREPHTESLTPGPGPFLEAPSAWVHLHWELHLTREFAIEFSASELGLLSEEKCPGRVPKETEFGSLMA